MLGLFQRAGRVTPGEVARKTGLSTGSVIGVTDRLLQAGYAGVMRVPDDPLTWQFAHENARGTCDAFAIHAGDGWRHHQYEYSNTRDAGLGLTDADVEPPSCGIGPVANERGGTVKEDNNTVDIVDVGRTYGSGGRTVNAVDGVSLSLKSGQFVAIVGSSGAGKSTLLHLIGGLYRPTSGSILVNGCDLAQLDDEGQSRYRRRQVGFIFQFFNLLPTLSAWENVAVPRLLDGTPMAKAKGEAVALLNRVGLDHRKDHRPAELSGGQMQRVAIARSLIMDPPVVLADEPTGNLDSKTGEQILDVLADIAHADSHRLVVMVTHDRNAAASADRVITMRTAALAPTRHLPRVHGECARRIRPAASSTCARSSPIRFVRLYQ